MPDMSIYGPFDSRTVEPNESRVPLPAGWYPCIISASENRKTKAGTGTMLSLEFTVVNGEFMNSKIFDRLNLHNPSADAVKIARGTLSSICRAVGVPSPKMSEELHNKPLLVRVSVKNRSDTGEPTNECKDYKASSAGVGGYQQPQTVQEGRDQAQQPQYPQETTTQPQQYIQPRPPLMSQPQQYTQAPPKNSTSPF